MPSRRAGGQWAGMEGSEECPAVTQAMPDDSHHLGVLIPPTKRKREGEREGEIETQGRRRKEAGRHIERQMDREEERSNETEWE